MYSLLLSELKRINCEMVFLKALEEYTLENEQRGEVDTVESTYIFSFPTQTSTAEGWSKREVIIPEEKYNGACSKSLIK